MSVIYANVTIVLLHCSEHTCAIRHVPCVIGKVQVLAFANFGTALRSSGADASKSTKASSSNAVLDYSKQELSLSPEARDKVCMQRWSITHHQLKLHNK